MSICISRHGEYNEHTLGPDYECETCGALDMSAALAEVARTRSALRAVLSACDSYEATQASYRIEMGQREIIRVVRAEIAAALGEPRP